MIHYLKRHEIDEIKYNNCIKFSLNSRIYAYSWYLDCVADNWDVLVLNDYEAIMPLPWKQKYFIKYVYPPAWTQQLGVFSKHKTDEVLVRKFIDAIPKKFKKITIQFNAENDLSLFQTEKRVNYLLPLNKPYEEIYKEYRTDRKNRVKEAEKYDLIIKNCSFNELEKIAKENYAFLNITDANYKKLKLITENSKKNSNGFIEGVYDKNENLVGGSIFLKDNSRISYLFSVITIEGKKLQAISFLINEVLKKHSNSNYIFDFEGSMINGVSDFYKSFGAIKEDYFLYKKPLILF